jgi:hypothetical protein
MRCGTVASDARSVFGTASAYDTGHVAGGVHAMAACGIELDVQGAPPELDFDDWDFDPQLRSLKRTRATPIRSEPFLPSAAVNHLIHPSHGTTQAWPTAFDLSEFRHDTPACEESPQRNAIAKRASWLAWSAMSVGLMAFMCGGVLLGWSFLTERPDLWNLGLPVTIAGQIALLIGLVLQLERIWQNNRYAVNKLEEVDERLADIKLSQSLLRVNHGSASQAFYAHMAEGANPSLLLGDLKGQLDLLAVRLADRR